MVIVMQAAAEPMQWDADFYATDDGPCREMAEAPSAHDFLRMNAEWSDDRVGMWCEIRGHLRDWLRDPHGIRHTLAIPMAYLSCVIRGYADIEGVVGDIRMPVALAHLLGHHGIDPRAFGAVAAWRLATWTVHLDGVRTDVDVWMENGEVRIGAMAHPDGIGLWDMRSGEICLYDVLPETVSLTAAGRPVSSIVSHPVIDATGIVIDHISQWSGSVITYRDGTVALRDIETEKYDASKL